METTAELEQQAAAGDAHAKYVLAARLLTEPDSHQAIYRGVRLVDEAAADNHPDAVAQIATMEAIGSWRPQNWRRAFDLLQRAAELGSAHARRQLRFLAAASNPDISAKENWGPLRGAIDLDVLLKIPERVLLADQPRLHAAPGFASAAECRWIMERAGHGLQQALVWDSNSPYGRADPARTNRSVELRLTYMDVVMQVIRARISVITRLPLEIFETPQVMHYTVGQEFRSHYDFLDPGKPANAADMAWRGQRIMTFLLFLNDDFEGGETEFPKAGLSCRGRTGDAIFFANVGRDGRPDPMTLHAGTPPSSGEKWLLSQWIRDRAPGVPPAGQD